jgi:hypothetical protein
MSRADPVRAAGGVLACVLALAAQAAPKPVRWVVTCPALRAAAQEVAPSLAPAPVAMAGLDAALPTEAVPLASTGAPEPRMSALPLAPRSLGPRPSVAGPSAAGPSASEAAAVHAPQRPAETPGDARPATPRAAAVPAAQSPPAVLPVNLDVSGSVAAAAAPARQSAVAIQRWEVQTADLTLDKTLQRWAQQAGYRLQWDAARTLLVGAPTTFEGEFETAVADLLGTPGIRMSDYPLEACLYANTPPLVRITRQGDQARECTAVNP